MVSKSIEVNSVELYITEIGKQIITVLEVRLVRAMIYDK